MFKQQVQCGIALLDERAPGWRAKVDLDALNMRFNCTLKQVFGDYREGLVKVGLGIKHSDGVIQSDGHISEDLGLTFCSSDDFCGTSAWSELTAEWKRQLGTELTGDEKAEVRRLYQLFEQRRAEDRGVWEEYTGPGM